MKIFFSATIQGNSNYSENYKFIVDKLSALGHKVYTDLDLADQDKTFTEKEQDLISFHKKVLEQMKKCDVYIAEVSSQRVSSGYWIALALELGKPTIALSIKGEDNYHLLRSLENTQKFTFYEYSNLKDLDEEIGMLIDFAADQQDTRFNFFISPKHQNYLDWISKTKKLPRSVYLRNLIEEDMTNNSEFFSSDFTENAKN